MTEGRLSKTRRKGFLGESCGTLGGGIARVLPLGPLKCRLGTSSVLASPSRPTLLQPHRWRLPGDHSGKAVLPPRPPCVSTPKRRPPGSVTAGTRCRRLLRALHLCQGLCVLNVLPAPRVHRGATPTPVLGPMGRASPDPRRQTGVPLFRC